MICRDILKNPQYQLIITKMCTLLVKLLTQKEHAVNLMLVRSDGQLVDLASNHNTVASSGDYRKHFCYFDMISLPEGSYTIIPTTFQPNQLGGFLLVIGASENFNVEPIKPEGDGMVSTQIQDSWEENTCGGNPSTISYQKNPKFKLILSCQTNIK
jgi:calpain-7